MSLSRVEEAIGYWINHPSLESFGLVRWSVECDIIDDEYIDEYDIITDETEACVAASDTKDEALILVQPRLLEADDRHIYRTMLHEVLHIAFRDYDVAMEYSEWIRHERERFVDRLTTILFNLCYDAEND